MRIFLNDFPKTKLLWDLKRERRPCNALWHTIPTIPHRSTNITFLSYIKETSPVPVSDQTHQISISPRLARRLVNFSAKSSVLSRVTCDCCSQRFIIDRSQNYISLTGSHERDDNNKSHVTSPEKSKNQSSATVDQLSKVNFWGQAFLILILFQ